MPAAQQEAVVVPLRPSRRAPLPVSAAMLDAGRIAFSRHRRQLDDLYDFFQTDQDAFLRAIYRAMDSAKAI